MDDDARRKFVVTWIFLFPFRFIISVKDYYVNPRYGNWIEAHLLIDAEGKKIEYKKKGQGKTMKYVDDL